MALGTGTGFSAPADGLFLSDHQELICESSLGWGVLGIDRAAHPAGETGMQLKIKDKVYAKGLGHHAPGRIVIELDGGYSAFEAEVGTQWVNGKDGSVVFQVFVDDEKRFDSGTMLPTDEAKPVRVTLDGAQELRLVLTDAGDGINCDLGNWANARLIPADTKKGAPVRQTVDIGRFARVVTFDPDRLDGARATRVQAFRPEDVYLETDLAASKSGAYTVPIYKDGRGCIGLQWIERRRLKTLEIEFAGKDPVPAVAGAQVQYWAGITRWQGEWKPLTGTISPDGRVWRFTPDASEAEDLSHRTMKVRWIFAQSVHPLEVRRLSAFSGSRWGTSDVTIQLKQPIPGAHADVELYNGEIVGDKSSTTRAKWDLGGRLRLSVRYSKPSDWKSDATMIRFKLPGQSFTIGMEDLLTHECVYVQPSGVFAVKEPAAVTLAEYEQKIARKKSILEMVRHMPDQTFASAMDHIYNTDQDMAPTMLSLSCSNDKFVLHHGKQMLLSLPNELKWQTYPEGTIRRPLPGKLVTFEPFEFRAELGSENRKIVSRSLSEAFGGWYPIPVTKIEDEGVSYTQTTFVAPYGKDASGADRSMCVMWVMALGDRDSGKVSIKFRFMEDAEKNVPATVERLNRDRAIIRSGDKLLAVIDFLLTGRKIDAKDGVCTISGDISKNGEDNCFVYLPAWDMKPEEQTSITGTVDLVNAMVEHWNKVMADAMQIDIPDPAFKNIILASQVHCLVASRTAADGKSIEPWVSSMWYQALESESNSIVRGMGLLGHTDFARKSLDHFIGMYSPEGFLTTGYTLMGTGWHLTTLGEFYALTHDSEWMKSIAPKVANLCKWIVAQREKTKKLDAHGTSFPESGLLPPGVMADWEPFAYYFCLNGHFHAGLKEAATALEAVKYPGAQKMVAAADEFRRDILKAYDWSQSMSPVLPLRDGTWVPAYPSQVYVFGPTANAYPGEGWAWCYDVELGGHQLVPQQVLDPNSRQTEWMMRHLEDAQYSVEGWCKFRPEVKDDWFNVGGFSKVQPYYSRNAEIYAMADDVKPFIRSYFNTVPCLLDREDLSFWEHPQGKGAWNKTHETGYFLQQSRFMMVMEHGDELWLAPLVTNNWMKDGMVVAAKNAPTRFGTVSYRITSHAAQGFIEARIEPPTRNAPKTIVIRLRHPDGRPIHSVEVNGKPCTDFDPEKEIVRIAPGKGTISVKAMYGE